jgi:hypothetical protein
MGLFTPLIKWFQARRSPQLQGAKGADRKELADDIWKDSMGGPPRDWAWGTRKKP